MKKEERRTETRLVLFARDIEIMLGRSPGTARRIYISIRKALNKKPGEYELYGAFVVKIFILCDHHRQYTYVRLVYPSHGYRIKLSFRALPPPG